MTDKLKCCFCGAELAPHIDEWKSIRKLFICNNTGCFCWGQPMLLEIWQALIDGKNAQGALNRAISEISELCFTVLYCSGEADNELELAIQHDEMVEEAKARIFGEITSITKHGEKK